MPPASNEKLAEIRSLAAASLRHLAMLSPEEEAEWRAKRKKEKSEAAKVRYRAKKERLAKEKAEAELAQIKMV